MFNQRSINKLSGKQVSRIADTEIELRSKQIMRMLRKGKRIYEIKEELELTDGQIKYAFNQIAKNNPFATKLIVWYKYEANMERLEDECKEIAHMCKLTSDITVDENGHTTIVKTIADSNNALKAIKLQMDIQAQLITVAQNLGLTHKEADKHEITGKHLHIVQAVEDAKDCIASKNLQAFENVNNYAHEEIADAELV